VVGIAIGVVLLPDLSRRLRADDIAGGRDAFNRAGEMALALTVPAAVALAVIPGPIVDVLFKRGAFDAADATATAAAVAVYGAGLPAFVMQKVLQPLFFAREDTRRPFYYALAALGVNAGIAIGLAPVIGYIAAAFGTTLAGWAMVWLLWRGSRPMGEAAELDARFLRRVVRIVASSALMGLILLGAAHVLAPWLTQGATRYAALALLIGTGILAYFGLGHLMGAFRLGEFRRAMRRQR